MADAPLVSVITRTLGRACLAEAGAAVAAQTYRPLEWIVVDASGEGTLRADAGHGVTTRVVGSGCRLPRAQAANTGLDAAQGTYSAWLDDDDLWKPGHVAGLVAALAAAPDARAAYALAEVWSAPGAVAAHYSFHYSPYLLARRNLFPPNAVLFATSLVARDGVRVDPALDHFEDWDFWLQCARHTRFVRVHATTAIYRAYLSQSGIERIDTGGAPAAVADARDRVFARHAAARGAAAAAWR
ncbi:MAG: glycosyltransferase, partial [Proteobacteria bacterium]|nr:glycosyltransferase [Pseudomonadota bacterium]